MKNSYELWLAVKERFGIVNSMDEGLDLWIIKTDYALSGKDAIPLLIELGYFGSAQGELSCDHEWLAQMDQSDDFIRGNYADWATCMALSDDFVLGDDFIPGNFTEQDILCARTYRFLDLLRFGEFQHLAASQIQPMRERLGDKLWVELLLETGLTFHEILGVQDGLLPPVIPPEKPASNFI